MRVWDRVTCPFVRSNINTPPGRSFDPALGSGSLGHASIHLAAPAARAQPANSAAMPGSSLWPGQIRIRAAIASRLKVQELKDSAVRALDQSTIDALRPSNALS
jgi:hypothetical protein